MPSPESQNRNVVALPFVGREQELADLAAAIASEEGRLILVVGPWQHGKTALLRELHRRNAASMRGLRPRFSLLYDLNRNDDSQAFFAALQSDLLKIKGLTWWRLVRGAPGTPDELKALVGLPFSLLGRIANATEVARAAKELAQSLVAGENRLPRERLLLVLSAVARRLKGHQRLVLMFDPQEYLHESCGPDWVWLAERLPQRVAVIIAQRDDDKIATCDHARVHARIRRVPEDALDVLSRAASDELVEYAASNPISRLEALGEQGLRELQELCWERWRGHPLLLHLVLPGLPATPRDKQVILNAATEMPVQFDALMERRWDDVLLGTPQGADALRCLSVLAARNTLDTVASVLGIPPAEVRTAVAHPAVKPLLKPRAPRSDELEILHISCADYILALANTDLERKRDLHRRAAQMYADRLKVRPSDREALVGVLAQVGQSGNDESLRVAIRTYVAEMARLRLWRPALRAVEQALREDTRLPEPERGLLLGTGGNLLSELGERAQARKYYEEALSTYRKVAEAEPGAYLPDVAMTLNNLGTLLSDLGERAQALEHYEEALSIRRKLAAAEPGAYLPNVATTLNNLGNLLSALGERAQARKDYEEALSIRRKLAAAEPRAFRERLRAVVNNASIFAQESGISANHWPALREALETLERLDREAQ
jgi:tetratricopeptide (TPR) repeat protein